MSGFNIYDNFRRDKYLKLKKDKYLSYYIEYIIKLM